LLLFSGRQDDFAAVGRDVESESASQVALELEQDDIKVVFHGSTGIPDQLYHFDDYCGTDSTVHSTDLHSSLASSPSPKDGLRPWHPFKTKLDFEIAEVMLDAHMNAAQCSRLFIRPF
jgi:hypothetical protein